MTEKKGLLDSLFDTVESVVDGASAALKDVHVPGEEDEEEEKRKPVAEERYVESQRYIPERVIDVPSEVKKVEEKLDGEKKKPREVKLAVKNVSKRRLGGVTIIVETAQGELVAMLLGADDWKKVVDAADWMRMVDD